MHKYKLGLIAVVKNEEMVLEEWIQHNLWQGVEHLYIIDNDSSDGTKAILKMWEDKGIVTYFFSDEKHQQVSLYNFVYNAMAKESCEWLVVCDCDEYIYNRVQGKTIRDFVHELDVSNINSIVVQWKMFGASGYNSQPKGIRESFVYRDHAIHALYKEIVNCSLTRTLIIHHHIFVAGTPIINPPELALNHYCTMSLEYWEKIKMTRGAADNPDHENVRTYAKFATYQSGNCFDDELKRLVATTTRL